MRISDWSSDVCSSDLDATGVADQALLLQLQQAPTRSSRPQPESRPTTTSVQLSAAESASLEAACSTDKYVNGPAAYRACVERQKAALAAGVRRPNLSVLSSAEQTGQASCGERGWQYGWISVVDEE